MKKQLFGTDGIRGVAGMYPLDPKTVYAVGMALARQIQNSAGEPAPARKTEVLIGMDTRESSKPIARSLAAGLAAGGATPLCAGVITTAGIAYLTAAGGFARGVMISASHNSFEDNGIKIFSPSGFKLPDGQEQIVEQMIFEQLQQPLEPGDLDPPIDPEPARKYLDYLLQADGGVQGLVPMKLIVDCANGAASCLAPRFFRELGMNAEVIHCQPDGRNINKDCGSMYLDALRAKVTASGAQLGVAFDGDADRALFVAEDGSSVDGDAILLMAAQHLAARKRLTNNLVVTTVMANMGLEKALEKKGLRMVRTPVGDKYVLKKWCGRAPFSAASSPGTSSSASTPRPAMDCSRPA